MNGLYLEGGGIFFFDIFKCSKKWVRLFMLVSDVLFYVSKTGLIFFCIEHRGFVHLVVILKEMIKKTEYNFVIIGQVASKSF